MREVSVMRYVGLLFTVLVLCLSFWSCGRNLVKPDHGFPESLSVAEDKNIYLNNIRHLPWEKKIEFLDTYHSMWKLDPKGVFEEIRVLNPLDSADKLKIDSLVEKYWKDQDLIWAPHTLENEPRKKFEGWLAYIKQRGFTSPGLDYLEEVAKFIFTLGPPDDEWEIRDEPCGMTGKKASGNQIPCPHLYMSWWSGLSKAITVAFEQAEDGEWNTVLHENMAKEGKGALQKIAVTEHQVLTKKPELHIYEGIEWVKTGVDVSAFPNSFDTTLYTVYISIGMPSKELLKLSVGDSVYVKCKVVAYDSKDSAIINDSLFLDPIPKSILEDGTWYPFYTNICLPRGKYTVAVAISSLDGKTISVHRIPKDIPPSPSGTGDILVSAKPSVIKDNIVIKQDAWTSEGVWRPGGVIVPVYPFGLNTSDSFYVYAEPGVEPDSDGIRSYKIECSLYPTKGKRKGEVELGELEYFLEEEEAKRAEKMLQEEEVKETEIKGRIKLFSMDVETEDDCFAAILPIPPTVETGTYNLVVTIKHKGSNNTIWKEIRIEQRKYAQ